RIVEEGRGSGAAGDAVSGAEVEPQYTAGAAGQGRCRTRVILQSTGSAGYGIACTGNNGRRPAAGLDRIVRAADGQQTGSAGGADCQQVAAGLQRARPADDRIAGGT